MRFTTKKKHITIGSILIFLLIGCSDGSDHSQDNAEGDSEDKPNAMTSLLSTHIEAVNKARGVEQILQDSFNKNQQIMDEQGQ